MVYSVRSKTPFISTKPIKMKRTDTKEAREIREFMESHKISVSVNDDGVRTVSIDEG